MTAPGGRTSANSAGRGVVLTILAVVIGFYLLAQGFDTAPNAATADSTAVDDNDGNNTADDDSPEGDDTSNTDNDSETPNGDETDDVTSTSEQLLPTPPTVTHPPAEVKVATVNGTGQRGLAGATADKLAARGFVTAAKNAASPPVSASTIYYLPSYGDDAKVVADALSAPANILSLAPANILTLLTNSDDVADFHIFVVLGTDFLIPVSVS